MIKLVAFDLDGTLLQPDGSISEEDKQALKEAAAKGVELVVSTGRPYAGVPKVVEDLGFHYAITTNGAAVYTYPEKELVYENCLDREIALTMISTMRDLSVYPDSFVDGNGWGYAEKKAMIDNLELPLGIRTYMKKTRLFKEDVVKTIVEEDKNVQKITVDFILDEEGNPKDYEKVKQLFLDCPLVDMVSGGVLNLEVTKKGVNKGVALQMLAEKLGIGIEETMAIGDSENDWTIVDAAGIGVCMENGEDIVKEKADYITKSNIESGVSVALRKFVLK